MAGRLSSRRRALGGEIATSTLLSSFTPTDATEQDVTGWSVAVPANSGPVNLWVPGGVYVALTTGTIIATTSQALRLYLRDDLGNLVAYSPWTIYGTGVSQVLSTVLPLGASIPNATANRVYRVRANVTRQGTSGASGQVIAGGLFATPTLRADRI